MQPSEQQTSIDRALALPMFVVTVLWLAIAGIAVHLLKDEGERYLEIASICSWILLGLMVPYFIELVIHIRAGKGRWIQNIVFCCFPPARLGAVDHVTGTTMWVPGLGWKKTGDELANDVELRLGYPMIGVALLILPLLGFEFVYHAWIAESQQLGFWMIVAETAIWLAFTIEFTVMISMVNGKVKYAKEHWLDVAIILLPVIAFLRVARLGRLSRLFKIKQLGKLGRTARVFRLRGLAMRAWRAVLILEIVDRLMHRDPVKRLKMMEDQLAEKEAESTILRNEIALLKIAIETKAADDAAAELALANATEPQSVISSESTPPAPMV